MMIFLQVNARKYFKHRGKMCKKINPFVACFLGITYLKKEKEK